ncbi:hypothetical protein [Thalassoroseus pseudoceratinae]|uniref:hypothetical protein n=1 Tax=Thalassoroseus pseudoceratinae TaxID=2713176 RepID=UPI001422EA69|nr:hypothetical protein [Thalassoroseus pseudoceratinae]
MRQLILTGADRSIKLLDTEALNRTAAGRVADKAFRPTREPPRLLLTAPGYRLIDTIIVFFRSTSRYEFGIGAVVANDGQLPHESFTEGDDCK